MGLFDFITKAQEKLNGLQKRIETFSPEELFKRQEKKPESETPIQNKVAKKIIRMFYADYPEIPYISADRPEDWIERAEILPKQCIIPKSIMTRFSDGLLPGHIYMLYWLKKHTNKKVPVYFEYKYGINFEKEKAYLFEHGYLDDISNPTEKGEKAISNHAEVIEKHSPAKPDSRTQILAQRDSLKKQGFKEYEFIANRQCCEICGKLNGKHFALSKLNIGANAPPMHEGCCCSIAAYSDCKKYEEWLNSL